MRKSQEEDIESETQRVKEEKGVPRTPWRLKGCVLREEERVKKRLENK